jgi:hypothetical protein
MLPFFFFFGHKRGQRPIAIKEKSKIQPATPKGKTGASQKDHTGTRQLPYPGRGDRIVLMPSDL